MYILYSHYLLSFPQISVLINEMLSPELVVLFLRTPSPFHLAITTPLPNPLFRLYLVRLSQEVQFNCRQQHPHPVECGRQDQLLARLLRLRNPLWRDLEEHGR
jgi:hypothetical protein